MKKTLSIFLSLLMMMSSLVSALPTPVETVESVVEQEDSYISETVTVEVEEDKAEFCDETAELNSESTSKHPQYGDLLFDIDFEKENNFVNGAKISKYGYVNPDYPGSDTWTIKVSGTYDSGKVATDDENRYYAFSNGNSKYPQLYVEVPNGGLFTTENGVYTISADVLADVTGDVGSYDNNGTLTPIKASSFSINARHQYKLPGSEKVMRDDKNGSQVSRTVNAATYVPGVWKNLTGAWASTSDAKSGASFDAVYQIIFNFNYANTPVNQDVHKYGFDNLKLYYKPFTADLTVDMNGNTVATPITGLNDYSTTKLVDISALKDSVFDHGDMILLGFAFTPDGEIITEDFYLTGDTTIYAVWKKYTKSKYSHEMSSITGVSWTAKGLNNTVPDMVPMTDEATGTQYLRFGAESADGHALIDDPNFTIKNHFSSKMPIADIKAIQVRYRVSKAPDLKEKYAEEYTNETYSYTYPVATSSTAYSHKKLQDQSSTHYFNAENMSHHIYFQTDDGLRASLSESRNLFFKTVNAAYNGPHGDKWVTAYYDLDKLYDSGTKNANGEYTVPPSYYWTNSNYLTNIRFDYVGILADGMTVDYDFIHFIERDPEDMILPECEVYFLNDGVKTPITASMSGIDYRKNSVLCFDFDRDIGLSAEEFYEKLIANGATKNLFDAACEYDSENFVYTLYEESLLRGKSFSFGNFSSAFRVNGTPVRFDKKFDNVTLTYLSYTAFNDGENLVPNGDFNTPYYNPMNVSSIFVQEVKDGSLYVTHTESASEWASNTTNSITLKENTKYYISLDLEHVPVEGKEFPVDKSKVLAVTLYFPRADSFFNFGDDGTSIDNDEIKYMPSLTIEGNWGLSKDNLGKAQNPHNRIMEIHDDAYYSVMVRKESNTKWHYGSKTAASFEELQALFPDVIFPANRFFGHGLWESTYKSTFFTNPNITLQTCFTNGKGFGLTKENNVIKGASAIAYKVDSFVVKEMFDVNFVHEDGTKAADTRWAAKDIEIYLPVVYDEYGNAYTWKDANGNIYDTEQAFVLTSPEDITLTAVSVIDKAPKNEEKTSVRTNGYTGIRFLASIDSSLRQQAVEYGFIVSRKVLLDNAGLTENELTFANSDKVKIASKASYSTETGDDYIYNIDGDTIFFTGLMVNIPEDKLDDLVVVRPYTKLDGRYIYGKPSSDSILNVARKACANGYCDANGNPIDEASVKYLKNVLEIYGENSDNEAILMFTAEEKYTGMKVFGEACTIEIVTDPTNPDNKVYKITPTTGSYTHVRSIDKMEYTMGATYEISADVMVITDEGAYSTATGEKLENVTINVDENGNVYTVYGDNTAYYQTGRGILYTTTHEPMTAKRLTANSFATVTTSAVCKNATTDGQFGFITDLVKTSVDGEQVTVRLPFYIDNVVIKKTAEPVTAE